MSCSHVTAIYDSFAKTGIYFQFSAKLHPQRVKGLFNDYNGHFTIDLTTATHKIVKNQSDHVMDPIYDHHNLWP